MTLWANDEQIGEGTMPNSISLIFTTYAGMDIGRDNGRRRRPRLRGQVSVRLQRDCRNVVFDLMPMPMTHEDEKALHEHHSRQAVTAGIHG